MAISPSAITVIADRYRIDEPLGRGGMAEVRAGTDLRLQRPVAVKLLLPEMVVRDDIRRRFEAEACAAASFSDPHAVAVYDTGEHDGQPYIVMERLPGETLAHRIAAGPADPEWVRQIAAEVLGALAAAHAVGLVHRDVKPGNILLTADGHAKIADFGIAKSLEGSGGALDLTGTGQLLGTPAYLPPERLDGGPATPQSDLYCLGVVLYEALTGRCPFPGETPVATAMAIIAGEYAPLDEVRPGLDPALRTAVERAMATNPAHRFDSAAAMAHALAPQGAGAPTLVDGVPHNVTEVIDVATLAAAAAGPVAAPVNRRRSWIPLAAVVGLVLFALLVAALNRDNRPAANVPVSTDQTVQPTTTVSRPAGTVVTVPAQPAPTAPVVAGNTGKGRADDKDDDDKGRGKGKG